MATKQLPEDRVNLQHLLQAADKLLAVLVPIQQQMNNLTELVVDMLKGGFTEHAFFEKVFEAFQQSVATGLTPHHLLVDYLDLNGLLSLSAVPEALLRDLEWSIATGSAGKAQRGEHAMLTAHRIVEQCEVIDGFIGRLQDLHRRLMEKLETSPPPSSSLTPPRPDEVAQQRPGRKATAGQEQIGFHARVIAIMSEFSKNHGRPPTNEEIFKAIAVSKATFYRKLKRDKDLPRILKQFRQQQVDAPPPGFMSAEGDIEAYRDERDEEEE